MPAEAVLGTILEQVSRKILEKLEKGKKLTTEDILLLYLDMTYKSIMDFKSELKEDIKVVRDELKRDIENVRAELREISKRIDKLYEMLAQWRREEHKT